MSVASTIDDLVIFEYMLTCPVIRFAGRHAISRGGLHNEWISAPRSVVDPDALGLKIALNCLYAVLPAKTRGFVTTEGHHEAHRSVGIDPHGSGSDPSRHCMRAFE